MSKDIIYREDAIKAIEELPNAYNGWSDAYDKTYIIGTLEEVPKADRRQGEWIPCSERLPSEEGRFLVTVQKEAWDRKYFDIEIAYCSPNHKWFNIANCEVLAWMPLPKPYGEREGE